MMMITLGDAKSVEFETSMFNYYMTIRTKPRRQQAG